MGWQRMQWWSQLMVIEWWGYQSPIQLKHGITHKNSWFAHEKWWFSIVMLVYQRLPFTSFHMGLKVPIAISPRWDLWDWSPGWFFPKHNPPQMAKPSTCCRDEDLQISRCWRMWLHLNGSIVRNRWFLNQSHPHLIELTFYKVRLPQFLLKKMAHIRNNMLTCHGQSKISLQWRYLWAG